jgi:large subunit ribosomal protein L10
VPLNLNDKQTIVQEVALIAAGALSLVAADYRGLTVGQMTKLRAQARKEGVYLRVVRNTLARRALEGTEFSCVNASLKGPLVLAFSKNEPGAAARLFRDFSKTNDNIAVKLLSVGGALLGPEKLNAVASLPTRHEALSQLAGVLQAPIVKLVRTLAEPNAMMVRTFAQIAAEKERAA